MKDEEGASGSGCFSVAVAATAVNFRVGVVRALSEMAGLIDFRVFLSAAVAIGERERRERVWKCLDNLSSTSTGLAEMRFVGLGSKFQIDCPAHVILGWIDVELVLEFSPRNAGLDQHSSIPHPAFMSASKSGMTCDTIFPSWSTPIFTSLTATSFPPGLCASKYIR